MSGDGCCCHDLERERIGASELEDAYAEAMGALNRVTAQRDTARDIAVRLEGECARLEASLRQIVDVLGQYGDANHPAQLCALMALGEWSPDAVIAEGES